MGVAFAGHATRVIPVEESSQVGQVRREALGLAEAAGFGDVDAGKVALAATELATNVLRHGGGGRILLSLVQGRTGQGVEVCSIDQGPGFSLARCLPDGYSSAGSRGQGLGAIQRQSQVFDAWSDARGSVVLARIYPEGADDDLDYGALRVPMRHQSVCGDAWFLGWDGTRLVAALVDGLGHGPQANEAAEEGMAALAGAPVALAADALVSRMHVRMAHTRGGAAAVFCHDQDTGQAFFAGVGNIAGAIHGAGGGSRGLASHPGIVGGQYRRAPAFPVQADRGGLLLMHSDGLQSRWNLGHYEGLAFRHPALVVAVLLRDFDRGRDDIGVIALRLGGRT